MVFLERMGPFDAYNEAPNAPQSDPAPSDEIDVTICGLPTRNGQPCRKQLQIWDLACPTHATPRDKAFSKKFKDRDKARGEYLLSVERRGYEMGKAAGRKEGEISAARPNPRNAGSWRYIDSQGRQIVQVGKKGYAYTWDGPALNVGDRVLVPKNWLFPSHEEIVTSMGTSYVGSLDQIIRVVTRVDDAPTGQAGSWAGDEPPHPQPDPTPGDCDVFAQLHRDIAARNEIGKQTYGRTLETHNGRDSLRDAYEEAIDLAVYLCQALMERES